jgi:TPP-dependent pyruvate/acetoin dehydrogenase alpha subunit
VCQALRPADVVFGTYRCHALYLAKGGNLKRMIAELYGKATGCAKGKAGSMHLIDTTAGVMGASAVVASTIPQAVGYAFAERLRGRPTVVVGFLGEGAVEEGVFHESLNFAALKRVPVLFVCENNAFAIHSHQTCRQARSEVCALARAHGLAAERFEDMDVIDLHEHARQAIEAIRARRSGPMFFECCCYRWREHVGPNTDFHVGYRSKGEAERWYANDPLRRLAERLEGGRRRTIEAVVEAEIEDAFLFAEESPFPQEQELFSDLYSS